jgi:hypothetical protein
VAAPGWYTDKQDPRLARWYDGASWTDHTVVIAEWAGRGTPPPPDQDPPSSAPVFGTPEAQAGPPPGPVGPAPGAGTPPPASPPAGGASPPPPTPGPPPGPSGYGSPPPAGPPAGYGPPPGRPPLGRGGPTTGFDPAALMTLPTGDKIIGVSGLITFVAAFLPWFSVSVLGVSAHASGWDIGFLWAGLPAIVGLALTALVVAQALAGFELPDLPVTRGQALLGAGGLCAALVLLKLLTGYHGTDRSFGIFLAMVSTLGLAAGGYLAFQDEQRR